MNIKKKVEQITADSEFTSLPIEERQRISKYMTEQQILTLYQVMEGSKDLTCLRWRHRIREWLETVIIGYECKKMKEGEK